MESALDSWLEQVRICRVRELRNFAKSLERDKAAVLAGLSLPYSNGRVEGQINLRSFRLARGSVFA